MALTRITKGVIKPNENYDTHNINSTGIITAIGFKGPFTGSSDIQSGIITATQLDLNGDLDVDGHTNLDNVNVAGVTTFAANINGTNASLSGSISAATASFSGNVSIGGTLTYEDVTNVDAVGLVTARTGVVSPYADIDDWIDVGSNIKLGNAGVVTATSFIGSGANLTSLPAQATIANNADNRVITGGSGVNLNGEANLTFDGSNLNVVNGGTIIGGSTDADVLLRLDHEDNTGKAELQLNAWGTASVSLVSNFSGSAVSGIPNGSFGLTTPHAKDITICTSGTERVRINSSGAVSIASNNYGAGHSSAKLRVGTESGGTQGTVVFGSEDTTTPALTVTNWDGAQTQNWSVIQFDNSGWGNFQIGGTAGADAFAIWDDTVERLRITSGGKVNIGGNYTQTTAPLSVTTGANSFGYRLLTGSNVVVDIMNNDAAGNSEIRGYYNNNSGTRGEGFRIESNGDSYFNPGGVTGLKIRANNGYVGAGKGTPGCALDVLNTQDQLVARFLSNHTTLGGGVQVKNNNQRGGLEFLYKDGSNQGAFYHSTGGWIWDKELQLVGTAKLRIGTTNNYGDSGLTVDTDTVTNGAHIAQFKGRTVGNGAGLGFVHLTCGSDDDRTGLQWEHQNVSNERMWFGDDKRLYLKNSNPSESTAQGRYIMTVEGGTTDFPDGTSYDNAAKSALEIKKRWPNIQTGNYWIYDYNGVPRHIRCDMEIDGGGWMLWNDYNTSSTSMNEALGGSSTSPHSGLGRGNYNDYKYYQVLIRASKIDDGDREALHTIVQLDHNGNLFRKYDYGEEFFLEDVGDPFNPTLSQYFTAGTGEYIKIDGAYQPQLDASGWETFSGGGWQQVWIRELDTRLAPGDHRSYAMHERVFGFNDNGVPVWRNSLSMGPQPYWTDIRGDQNLADGSSLASNGLSNDNIHDRGHTIYMNNGNNGDVLHGRCHGVFLGAFEISFKLSYWWGWAVGNMNAGIGVEESLSDGQAWPYYLNTNYGYAGFGLMNNSSNNLWYPNHFYNGDTSQTIGNGSGYSGGANNVWNIMWRTSDGTIKVRRQDNTHGTYTYGKFVGPLVFGCGYQSPSFTELGLMWDSPWNTGTGNYMR